MVSTVLSGHTEVGAGMLVLVEALLTLQQRAGALGAVLPAPVSLSPRCPSLLQGPGSRPGPYDTPQQAASCLARMAS